MLYFGLRLMVYEDGLNLTEMLLLQRWIEGITPHR